MIRAFPLDGHFNILMNFAIRECGLACHQASEGKSRGDIKRLTDRCNLLASQATRHLFPAQKPEAGQLVTLGGEKSSGFSWQHFQSLGGISVLN